MSKEILKDYGWCQIIKRHDKYFVFYDAGGISVKMVELGITKDEAKEAMINQHEAETVIRSKQKNNLMSP